MEYHVYLEERREEMIPDYESDRVWRNLVRAHQDAHESYILALAEFKKPNIDRVNLVRRSIWDGRDIPTVVAILPQLTPDELAALFPELVFLASWIQGGAIAVRQAILSLPKDWVVANIESVTESMLNREDSVAEYRRLLELYSLLDPGLTRRLASKALLQSDPEVREAGQDFLELYG